MTTIKNIFKLSTLLLFVSTCKKYPENNLWFKNPEKVHPFSGRLTKYNVNGVDSLDALNNYFGNAYGLKNEIRNCTFNTYVQYKRVRSYMILHDSFTFEISYEFSKNKKEIQIYMYNDTSVFKKKLFLDENIWWTITKLEKNGVFKAETTLDNGNTYELEIN